MSSTDPSTAHLSSVSTSIILGVTVMVPSFGTAGGSSHDVPSRQASQLSGEGTSKNPSVWQVTEIVSISESFSNLESKFL